MVTRRSALALACASGAVFALAAPPADVYVALWVGMAGLAYALAEPIFQGKTPFRRFWEGGMRGALFGTAANVVALRFVPLVIVRFTPLPFAVGVLALLLLAIEQSARWVVLAVVAVQLGKRGVPRWLAFGVGAFAGSFCPVVFPWTAAGGATPWPELVQLAEVFGERGVMLVMAVTSALAAEAARLALEPKTRVRAAALTGAVLAIPAFSWAFGALRMKDVEAARALAPHAKVGLVQPGTEAKERWDEARAATILERLTTLTKSAESRGSELTVWPEAAYPYSVAATARYDLIGSFAILQPGVRGPVLTGLMMRGQDGSYNSAVVVSGGKMSAPYHKMHLLAFGEGVPLAGIFPWIRTVFARGLGLVPGDHQVAQESGRVRAAVLNCFEDTLPEAGEEAIGVSPNLLVNITNDAWFYETAESELHLRLSVLRAVEQRRDLVRAVNRGPTSFVDATGRVRARYSPDIPGTLIADAALLEGRTPFSRAGDWPMAVLLGGASIAAIFRHKTRRAPRPSRSARE